jgi:uncharacterized membrane protein YfcA
MSIGAIILIILIIALLGGFSGVGGGPFYGTGYYGGGRAWARHRDPAHPVVARPDLNDQSASASFAIAALIEDAASS